MKISRILSLLLVAMLVVGALAACGPRDTEDPGAGGKDDEPSLLRLSITADIPGLDSTLATDQVSFEVLGNTIEGLYRLVGANEVQEGLVAEKEVSEDGMNYTFKLREDSKWSNGTPVTAHDFVYAWRKLADPENGGQYAFMIETAGFKNGSQVIAGELPVDELGVKASDDYTLEIELEMPLPYFESLMAFPSFYPINQEFSESKGEDYGTTEDNMLFNGPYVLSTWETEYQFTMTKNPDYIRADEVKLDEINYRVVKDVNTRVNMYEADEIDRVILEGEQVEIYKEDPNLIDVPTSVLWYLELNNDTKLFANKKARQAFALAIDKTFITDEILNNGSMPADYFIPYGLSNGPDGKDFRDTTGTYMHMDKEKAAQLWEEAKAELGIDEIELNFVLSDSDTAKQIGEYIQGQFHSAFDGVTVTLNQQPFNNRLELMRNGEFDIVLAGWGPDYADPMTFMDLFITDGGHNDARYSNPAYDEIIISSKTGDLAFDLEARWKELQKAEKILLEDAAVIPIYQKGGKALVRPYVKNMKLNSFAPDYYYSYIEMDK